MVFTFCLAVGCTDTSTSQSSLSRQREEEALRDPMNYDNDKDMPSVSGGGISELDRKGLKHDVNAVLNP